jgi:hypothetical protein
VVAVVHLEEVLSSAEAHLVRLEEVLSSVVGLPEAALLGEDHSWEVDHPYPAAALPFLALVASQAGQLYLRESYLHCHYATAKQQVVSPSVA